MLSIQKDEHYMDQALLEAQKAYDLGEVPVGAIIVSGNKVLARAHNQVEMLTDVTAHAEMIALTAAQNFLSTKYLKSCRLYVTLEPCCMCAGALYWSQISEVIVGARDPKRGFSQVGRELIHPKTQLKWDVKPMECSSLVQRFFEEMRGNNLK